MCSEQRTALRCPAASVRPSCRLPCPAPTRRESDRKQKLPDIAQGEARQNQLCYFGTWLIPLLSPTSRLSGSPPPPGHKCFAFLRGTVGLGLDFLWQMWAGALPVLPLARPLPWPRGAGF